MINPMNILWIAPFPIRAGEHPAPWLTSLAAELAGAGHRLSILTPSPRADKLERRDTGKGYTLIILPYAGGLRHLLSAFRTQVMAVKAFLKTDASAFDIIHVHGTEMQYASSLLDGSVKTPYIISIQGIINLYKQELTKKLTKRYLYWSLTSLYERNEVRHSHNFFCRTQWDQHFVRSINDQADITVCWEMLRPEFFTYEHPFTGKDILFMGGDNPMKALALCLRVFDRLAGQHPDMKLHIVGGLSPASYEHLLQSVAPTHITPEKVQLHGSLDAAGICQVYTDCFCIYHPSLIDNSPNSVCEAQVAGLPVIATRVGGVPSLIDHGVSGMLVEKNNAEDHYLALDRLSRDLALQQTLSRNSQKIARPRHNRQDILERTLDTYQKLAAYEPA
jgi:glycosyltransferase involved in cell wall biosynthesis